MKVQVLMSAYNGEKYIEEQVESIMNQELVDVKLLIRNDGSKDKTLHCLKILQKKFKDRIKIISGENTGYRRSFLKLLEIADKNVDYYAFSDQDDIWLPNKLIDSIERLEESNSWLYASSLYIVDEKLNYKYKKDISKIYQSFESFFIRTRLAGCTMVFNDKLLDKAKYFSTLKYNDSLMPDHDCILCLLSLLYGHKIVLDSKSNILHRRHNFSETGGGRGIKNRFNIEIKRIYKRKNSYLNLAEIFLNYIDNLSDQNIDESVVLFLKRIIHYKDSFKDFIAVFFDKTFTTRNIVADILIRIKILFLWY